MAIIVQQLVAIHMGKENHVVWFLDLQRNVGIVISPIMHVSRNELSYPYWFRTHCWTSVGEICIDSVSGVHVHDALC